MRKILKNIRPIIRPLLMFIICIFYDKKYLVGRYFDQSYTGFLWAIRSIWQRNILRLAKPLPWPSSLSCIVSEPSNIYFHPDDLHIFQVPGTYFQNFKAKIIIGKGSYIAQHVGVITANHDPHNLDVHTEGKDIRIGEKCWIGMNSVILPGVILGDETIVAAGSIVTKSFPQGKVVIAGVPARIIKTIV